MPRRLNAGNYATLAKTRHLFWIGELPANTKTKTWWQCQNGHKWQAHYNNIQSGWGCPYCSKHIPKTPSDYHALAEVNKIRWIGEFPSNAMGITLWQCGQGHHWSASYNTIGDNHGCPQCAAQKRGVARRLTAKNFHSLASRRGFEWIGVVVVGANDKTRWRCEKGHEWETRYSSIYSGSECPLCLDLVNGARVSKPQRQLHAMLGGELNYPVEKYRIDVALAISDVLIAVEYDAQYWHDPHHDKERDAFLMMHQWRILRVKSGELVPTLEQLNTAIQHLLSGCTYVEIVLDDWC